MAVFPRNSTTRSQTQVSPTGFTTRQIINLFPTIQAAIDDGLARLKEEPMVYAGEITRWLIVTVAKDGSVRKFIESDNVNREVPIVIYVTRDAVQSIVVIKDNICNKTRSLYGFATWQSCLLTLLEASDILIRKTKGRYCATYCGTPRGNTK